MKDVVKQLQAIADRAITDPSYFLVDVVVKGTEQKRKVIVLLDGDEGVTIDACAQVSRAMSAELEAQDLFAGAYTLEVSSPGLDHPITLERQYRKNIGRRVRVHLPDEGQVVGELMEVDANGITVNAETTEKKTKNIVPTKIAFADIIKTMVLVSFK